MITFITTKEINIDINNFKKYLNNGIITKNELIESIGQEAIDILEYRIFESFINESFQKSSCFEIFKQQNEMFKNKLEEYSNDDTIPQKILDDLTNQYYTFIIDLYCKSKTT